jgi:RNA-directed DNA polymerase
MNGQRQSDGPIIPKKPSNEGVARRAPEEKVEGRGPAEGNPGQQNRVRTQRRSALPQELDRIRQVANLEEGVRFTALWHHVYNPERLKEAYFGLKRAAAPGVDGQTWQQYGENLEGNLRDLSDRLARGAYQAKPVRRVYIPKADGRQRPIGVPVLEDKIVQRATVEVLNAVYEEDFLGFSYGFRPERHQHHALDALTVGLTAKKVNWVLDADIRGFFDSIAHEWLVKFVEHRIADQRVLRHLKKWLKAGVLEEGQWRRTEEGTPQGGSISPLLANIYLHYVLDLWVVSWRKKVARGEVIVVRFADDFIVGFQHHDDAKRFLEDLQGRLAKFSLELHADKTRLIEFGRFAADRRARSGQGKPETFDFLGFTHMCSITRKGKFMVRRKTIAKRLHKKLIAIKDELRRRLHEPIAVTGKWLASVLRGHFNYFGVPYNYPAISTFHFHVVGLWRRSLLRRSQKAKMLWKHMKQLVARWLPKPHITHPYPDQRLCVTT